MPARPHTRPSARVAAARSFASIASSGRVISSPRSVRIFADLSVAAPGLGFTQFSGGGPIFTGPVSAPVFATGTFQLTNNFFPDQNSTLTISQVASAVPEPATWAMMLIGFGALGSAMRRRKVHTTVTYA